MKKRLSSMGLISKLSIVNSPPPSLSLEGEGRWGCDSILSQEILFFHRGRWSRWHVYRPVDPPVLGG
jgi:hypothetical protein